MSEHFHRDSNLIGSEWHGAGSKVTWLFWNPDEFETHPPIYCEEAGSQHLKKLDSDSVHLRFYQAESPDPWALYLAYDPRVMDRFCCSVPNSASARASPGTWPIESFPPEWSKAGIQREGFFSCCQVGAWVARQPDSSRQPCCSVVVLCILRFLRWILETLKSSEGQTWQLCMSEYRFTPSLSCLHGYHKLEERFWCLIM